MTVHQLKTILKISVVCLLLGVIVWGLYAYNTYVKPSNYVTYYESGTQENLSEFQELSDIESIEGMVAGAESETLVLYVNLKTSEIAIKEKHTGNIFYSNPNNTKDDTLVNGLNKDLLRSQLHIEYFDAERYKKEMNNYSDSIANEQFVIQSIEQGIRITYTIGDMSKGVESLPMFITEERLQSLVLDKLDAKKARTVQKYYVESAKEPGYLEMRQQVADAQIVLNKMLDAFEVAGYSEAELKFDNAQVGYVSDIKKVIFTIPVDYKLIDDEFVAKINTEEITTDGPADLAVISFLNYFGAGFIEDSGYILVPSGSGALIEFNNGKENHEYYYEKVYGYDPVTVSSYSTQSVEPVRMPVYGIKRNNQAFLSRIIDGEAIASIKADVSGRINNYNYAGPVFTIRDNELISMFGVSGSNADLPLVEDRAYSGDLTLAFSFMADEKANYSGMAEVYREKLQSEGVLTAKADSKLPFYMNVIGVVEKESFFLGIPYRNTMTMTDPDTVLSMVETMDTMHVNNVKVRYQGWFNDGYYHDVARDIDVDNGIGGAKAMESLEEKLHVLEASFYPDVAFTEISSLSDKYSETFESARYMAGVNVFKAPYHPSLMRMYTFYEENFMRVVSPSAIPKHVDGFISDYEKMTLSGLSLRDLADIVTSDKNSQKTIDREWSKDILTGMVEKLSDTVPSLMVQGGNEYAWAYATDIVSCPLAANRYYIIDQQVPFMQMVLHGSINYGSTPLNLSSRSDERMLFLKLLETGAAPSYMFTGESSTELVKSAYQNFYATDYKDWIEEASLLHNELSIALDQVHQAYMVEHQYLNDEVVVVSYDNGIKIYINYSDQEYKDSNIIVPAKDYLMMGGE